MGFVHNTHFSQFIPPTSMAGFTATWAMGAGQVAGQIAYACIAPCEPMEFEGSRMGMCSSVLSSVASHAYAI